MMLIPDVAASATLSSARADWDQGVNATIGYWVAVIRRYEGFEAHNDELRARLDPQRPIAPHLAARLAQRPDPLAILDVGSGAAPLCGWTMPGRKVTVTAIDPLALVCSDLMAEQGIANPTPSIQCDPERVTEMLFNKTFDLITLQGSLTQCYDPPAALAQLGLLLKPGGEIHISNPVADADQCGYYGFHQWNLRPEENDLVFWRKDGEVRASSALSPKYRWSFSGDASYLHAMLIGP